MNSNRSLSFHTQLYSKTNYGGKGHCEMLAWFFQRRLKQNSINFKQKNT